MTDLIPNDLSHLSDDEFNALCPHDGHAPGPEPLSPAAQAVLDVIYGIKDPMGEDGAVLAAALRAAADQLQFADDYGTRLINADDLLAIATELENQ